MPGGTWSALNPQTQPGFYVNFVTAAAATIQGGDNGIVLIPFTADWGPVATFKTVASQAEFETAYWTSLNGTGRYAVLNALRGSGAGRGGARKVIAYRMAGATKAKATKVLQNTTPANMVTLTALYEGTRPAVWTVTVQTAASGGATLRDLILKENGVEIERFSDLPQADNTVWVTRINATDGTGSKYMTATANTNGVNISNVADVAFNSSAGDSGLTVSGTEYTAFQTNAENQTFSVLSPADLTDSTIRGAMVTWAMGRNTVGQRFVLVIGGAAAETLITGNTRSTGIASENVVNLAYTDLYDLDGVTVISTAKFAPRVAGMIADAGVSRSITQQRFSDVTLKVTPTSADILAAYNAGTLLLTTDSVGVKVQMDLTTYVANTTIKSRAEFGKIKSVRTHQQIESDLAAQAVANWLGGGNVNVAAVQSNILGAIGAYLKVLENSQIIQPGWTLTLDNTQNNTGNALYIKYGIATVKAIELMFNTITLA